MKHAKVIGWYGHANIGDESYKFAYRQLFPEIEFHFSDDTKSDYDNCILGGGNILDSSYLGKLNSSIARKKMILSVSATPHTPLEQVKNVDLIWVRDTTSYNLLQKNNIPCRHVPDIASILVPQKEQGNSWIKNQFNIKNLELYQHKVGVVVNAYLYFKRPDLLAREFISLMKFILDMARLADNTSASFIFFPMSTHMPSDDRITNYMVAGRCKFWRKNLVVSETLSVQDTLNLISACDCIITSRLHSTIFSISSEVPFIDVTHHDKNRNYLASSDLSDWSISYWSFDYNKIQNQLNEILSNDKPYRTKLHEINELQKTRLTEESKNVHFV